MADLTHVGEAAPSAYFSNSILSLTFVKSPGVFILHLYETAKSFWNTQAT